MLAHVFVETPDYKTLISTNERPIVVGRRGSGKSALLYGLNRYWSNVPQTQVVVLAPEEDQMIGLRPLIGQFGNKFTLLKAACRIAWHYAILLEIANSASHTYRFPKTEDTAVLRAHIRRWNSLGGFSSRLRKILKEVMPKASSPEEKIAELSSALELKQVESELVKIIPGLKKKFIVLIDRLDEGFEPDDLGTALADGLVVAAIGINDKVPVCQTTLLARDNIGRAVAKADPNYSRDIEGQVIRLHWDEVLLFNLTCARLRRVFELDIENDMKVWNRCTGSDLHGMEGFRKALRLTLFRPRDILALLNQAFYRATCHSRQQIVLEDLEFTAHEISQTRLDDLHKEYKTIIPGLGFLTAAFSDRDPELTGSEAAEVMTKALDRNPDDTVAQQHFEIIGDALELVRSLHGVGFVGIKDPASGAFGFCHDGSSPVRSIHGNEKLLVHPCYWMALGMKRRSLADTEAEEIHDDYKIHIESQTPEIRKIKILQHIGELSKMPMGTDGSAQFEEWCLRTLRILFSGQLSNLDLHPNGQSCQRRDIVGTVTTPLGVWKRIHEDYGTRQVVFEIKNQEGLGADEYRQVLSYLTREYGKCGFIVTRDQSQELTRDSAELKWTREMYNNHNALIIRLSSKFLVARLSKAISPQKHDDADAQLAKIVDNYVRLYIGGRTDSQKNRKSK